MWKFVGLILIALIINLQIRLWDGPGSIRDVLRLKQVIKTQNQELDRLSLRNKQLEAEVKALKAEPYALEERARAELGMIKENETFCLVVEPMR